MRRAVAAERPVIDRAGLDTGLARVSQTGGGGLIGKHQNDFGRVGGFVARASISAVMLDPRPLIKMAARRLYASQVRQSGMA